MRLESFAAIRLPNQSARIMRSVIEEAGLAWKPLLSEAGIPADITDEPNGVLSGAQESPSRSFRAGDPTPARRLVSRRPAIPADELRAAWPRCLDGAPGSG
jgi:hypothetical protein